MHEPAPRTIAIVGAGVAGTTAALTLRQEGFDGRIVLIGDEPHTPYRRPPLSKELLKRSISSERIRLKAPTVWEEQAIELHTHTTVTGIEDRALLFADGTRLGWDRLLLATGGRARTLPQVAGHDHVHTLRTLDDLADLRADLEAGGPLLVIGAGLVGLEVAATARRMGLDVTVVEAAREPLCRILPSRLRKAVVELHRSHGVEVHTDVRLQRVSRHGRTFTASAQDGRGWHASTILVAVGILPRVELAVQAGVETGDGILVDPYGATSIPHIYAAGDVARHLDPILGRSVRIEQWNHAQEHAAATARNMLGAHVPFAAVPWGWSDQYGITLQFAGHPAEADAITVQGEITDFDFTALATCHDRPVGAVAAGRPADFRALRTVIAQHPYQPAPLFSDPA